MAGLWYQSGSIPDAIAESKRTSKLFVVYISGNTEDSRKMDEMWKNERVQSLCKLTCVALKLDAESEECKQFSAIYPVLSIPSVYFIDKSGKILEALVLQSTVDEFVSKIAKVTEQDQAVKAGDDESTSHVQSSEVGSGSSMVNNSKQKDNGDRFGEKMKRTREKEAKEESKHERQRREWSKNLQERKDAQSDARMKRDIEERKEEKLKEKAARERVKKQIEQDKLDRAARFQQEKSERIQAVAKQRAEKDQNTQKELEMKEAEKYSCARLQFRVPDGSTLVHQFDAEDVLRTAYDFVVSQNMPTLTSVTSFDLSLAYPRRVFLDDELSHSFLKLGMVPTASLIILPKKGKAAATSPVSTDGILSVLLFILMIPVRILSYIWNFLMGQPNNQSQSSQQERTIRSGEQYTHGESSIRFRRQGYMTRFGNVQGEDDDDDDNATWNGNSTQQM